MRPLWFVIAAAIFVAILLVWVVLLRPALAARELAALTAAASDLTDPDPAVRSDALETLTTPTAFGAPRLLRADPLVGEAIATDLPAIPDDTARQLDRRLGDAPAWERLLTDRAKARLESLERRDAEPKSASMADFERAQGWLDFATEPIIADWLTWLAAVGEANVRAAALQDAVRRLNVEAEPIVRARLGDPDEDVARAAWLAFAWLDPAQGRSARWTERPEPVGEAILLASVLTASEDAVVLDSARETPGAEAQYGAVLDYLEGVAPIDPSVAHPTCPLPDPPPGAERVRRLHADACEAWLLLHWRHAEPATAPN